MRGQLVAEYTVEAHSALAAIDQIEKNYGDPPQVELKIIQHENGTKEHMLVVSEWHGYCFLARELSRDTVR